MAATRERIGRPTQFHGVSVEERAFDTSGNRLPWALEWADDHPNARHHKRVPEEKGSFGKSTRRKASSRASRTQTPARKENPTLEGFEAALKFEQQNEPQRQAPNAGQTGAESSHSVPSINKEPMQVMLYGYSPETQWAAIDHYERASGGMICEEYEREPPIERRRYATGMGGSGPRRALTKAERALAMIYKGGDCWIKVTFDSREAAERAMYDSPHLIQGHWVYAQPYLGQPPPVDEALLIRDEDRQQGLLGAPKASQRPATLGASFAASGLQRQNSNGRPNSTLPRSFTTAQLADNMSDTSATASSATAIDPETPQPNLRQRGNPQSTLLSPADQLKDKLQRSSTFTHFPSTPRTVLRPATEAFLPQPTWSERLLQGLATNGWIPGDMIGSAVPRLEDGTFDWARASVYWRLCHWLDGLLGTDLCGMRE